MAVVTGLRQAEVNVDGVVTGVVPVVKNGALMNTYGEKVQMEIEGRALIGVRWAAP